MRQRAFPRHAERGVAVGACVGLALYLCWPLLQHRYAFVNAERTLFHSYLSVFTATLRRFELPLWNEYVGAGHPVVLFGQYPLNHTALFYGLFGISEGSFTALRLINLSLLLLGYVYGASRLGFSLPLSILGALTYFSTGWCLRWFPTDTVTGVFLFFPPVLFLLIHNLQTDFRDRRGLAAYYLFFLAWSSGGHITFLFMPAAILCAVFLIFAVLQPRLPVRRAVVYFAHLVLIPWLAVLGQIYFVAHVVGASNRLRPGLILPLTSPEPVIQLFRSLAASSYFWTLGVFLPIYLMASAEKVWAKRAGGIALAALALFGVACRLLSLEIVPFDDYRALFGAIFVWEALGLSLIWGYLMHRESWNRHGTWACLVLAIAMVSYFLLLPGNNPSSGNYGAGYDYMLFVELPNGVRVGILALVFLASFNGGRAKETRLVLSTLLALYLCRSHLAIPLMRYLGVVWYGVRDGIIHCCLFSLLLMVGLEVVFGDLAILAKRLSFRRASVAPAILCAAVIGYFASVTRAKLYDGTVHQSLSKVAAGSPSSKWQASYLELHQFLSTIKERDRGFYRVCTPGTSPAFLAGAFQDLGLSDASIYDSSIPSDLDHFYRQVIMGIEDSSSDLKSVLPCSQFPKHVHLGLQVKPLERTFPWVYLYDDSQRSRLKKASLPLWWQLAQVKYLVVTNPGLYETLESAGQSGAYEKVAEFDDLPARVYKISGTRPHSRWALIELGSGETAESMIARSNSDDVETLKALALRLRYPREVDRFSVAEQRPSNAEIVLSVTAPGRALLFDFEGWSADWRARENGALKPLQRAFHAYRALEIGPGVTSLALAYQPAGVKWLFLAGLLAIAGHLCFLLGRDPCRAG